MSSGGSGGVRVRIEAETSGLRAGVDQAAGTLHDFQRTSSRAMGGARAFADAISAISGASSGASRAVGTLLGGFAIGGPMGLAIGGVQALVGHLRETAAATEAAKAKAEALAEQQRNAYEEETRREEERRAKRGAELSSHIADLQSQLAIEKAGNNERERAQIAHDQKMAALNRQYEAALAAGQFEIQAAIGMEIELEERLFVAINKNVAAREAEAREARALAREIAVANAQFEADYERDEAARRLEAANADVGSVAAFNSLEAGGYDPAAAARAATEGQREYNAEVERSAALAEQWGQTLGTVIGQLATDQITAGQAIAQISQTVVASVVQAAISQITANAATAASGAAASQAPIPVIGPVLAISAMGAMLSAVLGLLGSLPSARGGWDVPSGWNGLAMIHENEMILPQEQADLIRRGGAGSGGITVNIGGAIMSDRDLERTLTARDGGLARAQRKMARRRRT